MKKTISGWICETANVAHMRNGLTQKFQRELGKMRYAFGCECTDHIDVAIAQVEEAGQ